MILLRISTKQEILEILLTNITAPRELNPVLEHLEPAMHNAGIILEQDDFNELECQLDTLAFLIDADIFRQAGDFLRDDYELLYWIGNEEVIIGEFDYSGK